ncbi:thiamine phosphate synthase [Luteimonas kalidii]|uniref:Thiamine-phosphate synthase n=1 Tax=Luteimonas kalidii TaxID=3042025 RepID=A0ABT6JVK1_9GAMM|nr:thiamine phosphate synthase [Luteimonas kalidii]MDH5834523.1 thiamine phosphate synthase [Luteimonas kalidii]
MPLSHSPREGETTGDAAARVRGLYPVTPDVDDTGALLALVVHVLPHATWLQYRHKTATPALRRTQVAALLPACRAAGVPLIVNDDWRLAAESGADGAHLGEDDGDLQAARAALGRGAILGASCYDALERARRAVDAGASYVAFGAFFPTATKATTRRASPDLLRAAAGLGVPRVAIGGITVDNAPGLVAAGADLLAVVNGVFGASDPRAAAQAYLQAFAQPRDTCRR